MWFEAPFHFYTEKGSWSGPVKMGYTNFVKFFSENISCNALNFWGKNLDVGRVCDFLSGKPVEAMVISARFTMRELFTERTVPFLMGSMVDGVLPAEVQVLEAYMGKDVPQSFKDKFQPELDAAQILWDDAKLYVRITIQLRKAPVLSNPCSKITSFTKCENSLACIKDILEHTNDFYVRPKTSSMGGIIVRKSTKEVNVDELFIKNCSVHRRGLSSKRMLEHLFALYPDKSRIAPLNAELAKYTNDIKFCLQKESMLQDFATAVDGRKKRCYKWIAKFEYYSRWLPKRKGSFRFGPKFFSDMYSHIYAMRQYIEGLRKCSDTSEWCNYDNCWFKTSLELYEGKKPADEGVKNQLMREKFYQKQEAEFRKAFLEEMKNEVKQLTRFIDIQASILRKNIKGFPLTDLPIKEVKHYIAKLQLEAIKLDPVNFMKDEDPVVRAYARSLVMGIKFLP